MLPNQNRKHDSTVSLLLEACKAAKRADAGQNRTRESRGFNCHWGSAQRLAVAALGSRVGLGGRDKGTK
jgi:hypothetical protein